MSIVRRLTTLWKFKVERGKVDAFVKSVDTAKSHVNNTSKAVGKLGKQVRSLGAIALKVGGALTAGLVIPALKIEDSLKNTMTMTSATGKEFQKLESGMLKLSKKLSVKMGMSATQINEGFYAVLSTGAKALSDDFLNLSDVGLKFAKVGNLAPVEAIEKLADTVNAFGLSMKAVGPVADRLFKTTSLASTNIPQLTEALKEAAPAAGAFGISMETTLAVLGLFAQSGIKSAQAGTTFRMVLGKLSAPTGEAAKWIEKLEVDLFDAQGAMRPLIDVFEDYVKALEPMTDKTKAYALKAIMGEEASAKFAGLLSKNMPMLRDWIKQIGNADDALERALIIKMSSALQQLRQLGFLLLNTAADIGEKLIPKIKETGKAIHEWAVKNQADIVATGGKFVDTVSRMIDLMGKHKDTLITTGKVMATIWAVTKVVAFGIAVKGVIVALAPIISGLVLKALTMIGAQFVVMSIASGSLALGLLAVAGPLAVIAAGAYAVVRAFKEMFFAMKAVKNLEKSGKAADRGVNKMLATQRTRRIKREVGKGNTAFTDAMGPGWKRDFKNETGLSVDEFMESERTKKVAKEALDKLGEGKNKPKIDLGNAEVTGGNKLKNKIESELEKIFAPGFSKSLKLKFQHFLSGRSAGGGNAAGIYGNFLGRSISAQSTMNQGRTNIPGSGSGTTIGSIQKTNHFNIKGNDPQAIVNEIESRDRSRANDFGIGATPGGITIPFE